MSEARLPSLARGFLAQSGVSYRTWLGLGYALVLAASFIVMLVEFQQIDENIESLARDRGAVLFRLIEVTRDWNAQHGGVYVPASASTPPNPYLEHPRRDLTTTDGQHLTMVNPAYMTRQIAEIARKAQGVQMHITSLKPIRPANLPDAWEATALQAFETGQKEVLSLIEGSGEPVHRYMAPLIVKPPCMDCHAKQQYKVGDIRGGISITMPAGKVLEIRRLQRERVMVVVGIATLVILTLLHLVASRSRRFFQHLAAVTADQERLIVERTRDLSSANAQLQAEVAERKRQELAIRESESRYRSVIESSQNAILIMQAPEFRIVFANEQAGTMVAMEPRELLQRTLVDIVHPLDRPAVSDRLQRRGRGEPVSPTSRVRFAHPDGHRVRVGDVHVERIETSGAHPQWVLSVKDVTDRLESERALQISAAVMESAAEGIIVTDSGNRIIQVNPAFTAITGYRPQEVLGKDPKLLGSGRHDGDFFRGMWESLDASGHWEGEMWNRRPDGTVYVVWLAISAIKGEGVESGGRHVATFIDITQRKEVEELLRHRAQSDPLTDLPNRNLFYDRLTVAFSQARRYEEEFALLYVDLDHFKEVNDTLGHAAGDELLIETARRLNQVVRQSDTVARLGGDEFAVILPKITGLGEVEEIAQRIVAVLRRPFELAIGHAEVSASVGVALYPQHGGDIDALKAAADAALYAAKEAGRNTYRIYPTKP